MKRFSVTVATVLAASVIFMAALSGGASIASATDVTVPVTSAPGSTVDTSPVDTSTGVTTLSENPFLPTGEDLGSCVGVLERPDCGSDARGGGHQLLVLAALVLGLGLVGWRVVVGVRRNERARNG